MADSFFDLSDPASSMPFLGLLQGLGAASMSSPTPVPMGAMWGQAAKGLQSGYTDQAQLQATQLDAAAKKVDLFNAMNWAKMTGTQFPKIPGITDQQGMSFLPPAASAASSPQQPAPPQPAPLTPPTPSPLPQTPQAAISTLQKAAAQQPTTATPPTPPAPTAMSAGPTAAAPAATTTAGLTTAAAPAATGNRMSAADIDTLINQSAQQYGLDPNLFRRQLYQESGLRTNAVSKAGAQGIAQFMPATARTFGINPMDPQQAIPAAAQYMRQILDKPGIDGDYAKALAGYNWGPDRAARHGLVGLPAETQQYISAIMGGRGGGGPTPEPTASDAVYRPGQDQGATAQQANYEEPDLTKPVGPPGAQTVQDFIAQMPPQQRQMLGLMGREQGEAVLAKMMFAPRPMTPEEQQKFHTDNPYVNPYDTYYVDPMTNRPVLQYKAGLLSPQEESQQLEVAGAKKQAEYEAQMRAYMSPPTPINHDSRSILSQTGMSQQLYDYYTKGQLPRMGAMQKIIKDDATTWAQAHNVDTATVQANAQAINNNIQNNLAANTTMDKMQGEINGTIKNLQPLADAIGQGKIKVGNVLNYLLKGEVNDPNIAQYTVYLNNLKSELASFHAASGGKIGEGGQVKIGDEDERNATNEISDGLNKNSLQGILDGVNQSAVKNKAVLDQTNQSLERRLWKQFDVDQYYDHAYGLDQKGAGGAGGGAVGTGAGVTGATGGAAAPATAAPPPQLPDWKMHKAPALKGAAPGTTVKRRFPNGVLGSDGRYYDWQGNRVQ